MRTFLATLLVAAMLPAGSALASNLCPTVYIGHDPDPTVDRVVNHNSELTHALVGQYVWFAWGTSEGTDYGRKNTLSFDVSDEDIESITACPDGEVTIFRTEPPEAAPAPTSPAPTEPDTPPLRTVCEAYRTTLGHVCELPNLRLVIS